MKPLRCSGVIDWMVRGALLSLGACEPVGTLAPIPVATCAVSPVAPSLAVLDTVSLSAVALDSRGDRVRDVTPTWRSLQPGVASVDAGRGMVLGVSAGTVQVIAMCGNRSGTATVTIMPRPVARVQIAPSAVSLNELDSVSVRAVALDDQGAVSGARVLWASSDATIATIDTAGRVIGVAPGSATISASVGGVSATASVRVAPRVVASVALAAGALALPRYESQPLSVTVRDASGRLLPGRVPLWAASAPAVASVSAAGVVTAHTIGTSIITATVDGKSASASVTVVPPATVVRLELTPLVTTLLVGRSQPLLATPRDSAGRALANRVVSWSSSAPSVATVEGGTVTAIAPGTSIVTATVEGVPATATVTVLPVPVASLSVTLSSSTVRTGQTVAAVAVARDSAGGALTGRPVTWRSSNAAVATVSPTGVVRGVAEGSASITATVETRVASVTVSVTAPPVASLEIVPVYPSVPLRGTRAMQAIAYDSAGNPMWDRVMKWSTANATIATVDAQGVLTGVGLGNTNVYVETGGKTMGTYVTVRNIGAVSEVQLAPGRSTLLPGHTQPLVFAAQDSYGFEVAGRPATYASSDLTVATVSSDGLVRAVSRGSTTVTVTVDGKTAIARVDVIPTFGQPFAFVATSPSSYSDQLCAVLRDGRAYCAGSNWNGQLGNGTTARSDTLVRVATAVRFVSVAVGESYACGVATDGAAWCWGSNSAGQLGDGSTIGRLTPVAVAGGHKYVSLVATTSYTCGVTTDGAARCWGSNARLGLGVGGATAGSTVPVPVAGGHQFARLSVTGGGQGICGISTSQLLLCWGDRIPDGTSVARATPVEAGDGRRFTHLVDGTSRTCGLDAAATVWCTSWSSGSLRWQRQPGSYSALFGEGGASYVCARLSTGRIRCAFGSDPSAELLLADMPPTLLTISVGAYGDAYGIDANGRLLRWGLNSGSPASPGPLVMVVP
jgi:uncharacterized protein YjdB